MKKFILVVIVAFLFSCSSDDNNEPPYDVNLLFGQWYRIDYCEDQNSLLLNEDFTYIRIRSGNQDCDNNEYDTYLITGKFSISNDDISFEEINSELYIAGDNQNIGVEEFPSTVLFTKIFEINENELVIARKIRDAYTGEENIYSTSYER